MLTMLIANLLGIICMFFLLWFKLKEDYHYERIFNFAFIISFFIGLALIFSNYFYSNYWFWINLVGLIIGYVVALLTQKIKFYESLDAIVIAMLPHLGLVFLFNSVINSSLSAFIAFWIVTFFVFIYFYIDANYRKFNWYKSGRVGFSGLFVAGLFFLVRAILSYFYPTTISILGSFDLYLSATFSFLFFLLLFNLSRKVL